MAKPKITKIMAINAIRHEIRGLLYKPESNKTQMYWNDGIREALKCFDGFEQVLGIKKWLSHKELMAQYKDAYKDYTKRK